MNYLNPPLTKIYKQRDTLGFVQLGHVDVTEIKKELDANDDLWNVISIRKTVKNSPF